MFYIIFYPFFSLLNSLRNILISFKVESITKPKSDWLINSRNTYIDAHGFFAGINRAAALEVWIALLSKIEDWEIALMIWETSPNGEMKTHAQKRAEDLMMVAFHTVTDPQAAEELLDRCPQEFFMVWVHLSNLAKRLQAEAGKTSTHGTAEPATAPVIETADMPEETPPAPTGAGSAETTVVFVESPPTASDAEKPERDKKERSGPQGPRHKPKRKKKNRHRKKRRN